MTEVSQLLRDVVSDLLSAHCTPDRIASAVGGMDSELWTELERSNLTMISVPEACGGSGGSVSEAGVVLRAAAGFAAQVPLAETLAAARVCVEVGLPPPKRPTALGLIGVGGLSQLDGDTRFAATLRRVPYAGIAASLVLMTVAADGVTVVILDPADYRVVAGRNLADEPRDTVIIDAAIDESRSRRGPLAVHVFARRLLAVLRSIQLVGAAERALTQSLTHARDREQFGRPLAHFQVIQHALAEMAAETALMASAADSAAGIFDSQGVDSVGAGLAAAIAKTQTSSSADTIVRIAHQIHGAIGYTREHSLRQSTSRLSSWSTEQGNNQEWYEEIGRAVLGVGPAGLWQLLTDED